MGGTTEYEPPTDCGTFWKQEIPNDEGTGTAWGYYGPSDDDVVVEWFVNNVATPISYEMCLSPHEVGVMEDADGCGMSCDQEYLDIVEEMRAKLLDRCKDAMVTQFNPDLTAPTEPGHDDCDDASDEWVLYDDWTQGSCGACNVMAGDCLEVCPADTDTAAEPYQTSGAGPEPFSSYTISCSTTRWACDIPQGLVDDFHAIDVDDFMDTATRLEQHLVGGTAGGPPTPDGMELAGIASGSLADKLEFENGDIIQEVNSLPFTNIGDWHDVFVELRSADTATLKVYRDPDTLYPVFTRVP